MIRKGKFLKNTAVALAIISVFGSTLSSVSATEIVKNTPSITQYVNGNYGIDLSILKENTEEKSSLHNFYDSAEVEISDNKMYMIINFKNNPMIQTIQPKINGENVVDMDDSITTVKFEISSLDDNISLYVEINTGVMGVMAHNCDVKIEKAEIPTVSDKEEVTEDTIKEDISITLRHLTEDKDSSGNKYLQSSQLKTVDTKKYIVMTFNSGSMFTAMQASIKGKDVETKFEKNEANDTATVEFEISSLSDYMELSFSYNTPIGAMTHSAKIQTEENKTAEKPEDDAVTSPTPGTGSGSNSGSTSTNEDTTNTYENGYYQLKNIVHSDNTTGYNMVRNILSETTNMEVKDGKIYMTLKMGSYSLMGDITIKVDGTTTKFTKNEVGNDTVELTFEVPSVESKVNMSMTISAMGRAVDFGVTFDKDSVDFISSNEEPTIPDANGGTTNNGSTNSGITDTTTTETVKGKLYTIQNQIVSDSETGKTMARKYLNSTTKIEEVDGKMYATLTFTGVDLMSNHKIYVNGSLVNYTVTSSTLSSKSIRFAIPNVNADIKVQVYVVPMGSTVTFGVKLLADTLTFVKEFDAENGTLPQTGSVVNSQTMVAAGGLLTMAGALLRRKRK